MCQMEKSKLNPLQAQTVFMIKLQRGHFLNVILSIKNGVSAVTKTVYQI